MITAKCDNCGCELGQVPMEAIPDPAGDALCRYAIKSERSFMFVILPIDKRAFVACGPRCAHAIDNRIQSELTGPPPA